MKLFWLSIVIGLLAVVPASLASEISESALLFSKGASFSEVKVSPGGEYLAVKMKHEGKKRLLIFNTEDMKLMHSVFFAGNAQVGSYAWVNDERLVLAKEYLKGWDAQPQYYGELMAVNADGKKASYLFGYASTEQQAGSHIQKNTAIDATAYILDPLPNDKRYMLVSAIPWGNHTTLTRDILQDVYRVDVYRGVRQRLMTAPVGNARFMTDTNGEVRIAVGEDSKNDTQVFYRHDGAWVNSQQLQLNHFKPISFATDDNSIYATANVQGEPDSVYQVNLSTGDKKKVVSDPTVDPSHFWINPQNGQLYAVEFENGYPAYSFVSAEDPRSQYLKQLLQSLPGYQVRIVSEDRQGDKLVILAFNDRDPGTYYLYYPQQHKLRPLLKVMEGIDPAKMAEVQPLNIKARDGLEIQAFLTLPLNKPQKSLPLIVNPHGGPHYVRDYWEFIPQNQFLAAHGYAVLQVNYRGSGGYGEAFQEAGFQKWSSDIQYDIIDATRYLIDQGIADKNRICIVGASFGGYSALQSAELAPDLFRCAVGEAGVYDLPMMFTEGDVQKSDSGVSYLKQVLGDNLQTLQAMSPANHVDKLKAKLLLVHGGNDERAPIEQFEALEKSLKQQHYPYEKMVIDDEGHGFYRDSDRAAFYQRLLDFLDNNLKQ
ncbi:alpha/beta hydrolase family protein [Shewanella fodinae]|uniref:alpha/beta hydrolase family protein n=1 Tax=Shewanella fodinae TaxID=552357 RepID=UPI0016799CD8|nr:S9 family peptidase [Shewanella fodinae]MCL2907246.1 S9 family peptidase [Shewanella fodinae]GGZ07620.1 peptidase S9 [Shewanella fodinae]